MKTVASVFLVVSLVFGPGLLHPVLAQNASPDTLPSPDSKDDPANPEHKSASSPLRGIDPTYLEDRERFYRACEDHRFQNVYYDCQCLADEYLEKRLEYGEKKPPEGQIESAIYGERLDERCADLPAIADYMYKQCITQLTFMRHRNSEEVCSCFGNTYASSYAANPSLNSSSPRNLKDMQVRAYLDCGYNANNTEK
ncbi:MAG: hypothetical protein EOM12_13565 [Verrucomicrobiae bacterium]|nr:hypothetical protein [Verrucomicrobiae bacterium]